MKLNSDELGEKGESRFKELCADAKLICNKSDRDRTGWDFIVEFPFDKPDSINSLDKRPSAISCNIQLKTMWVTSNRFKVRLSSAERIAKELKPTFFYVLRIDENLQVKDAYLYHITGTILQNILKRLRKEQKNKNTSINKKYISFDIKAGEQLEPTGLILKKMILSNVDNGMKSYIEGKATELDSLGFESNSHIAHMTFIAPNIEHFVDAFLGLTDIEVEKFQNIEKRFGIELPISPINLDRGTLSIDPSPSYSCNIIFKKGFKIDPVIIKGDVYLPGIPNLPFEHLKFLIKTPFFDLIFHKMKLKLSSPVNLDPKWTHPISVWINLFNFFNLTNIGECSFTINIDKYPGLSGRFKIVSPDNLMQDNNKMLKTLNAAKFILDSCGILDREISLCSLMENEIDILTLKAIIDNKENIGDISFQTEETSIDVLPAELEMLYINYINLPDDTIAYCAIAQMTLQKHATYTQWKSRKLTAHSVQIIHFSEKSLHHFVEQQKSETGIDAVFFPQQI